MAIKDVIATIRKEAGIMQEEMARRLYVTRQAVSRWEQGETTPGIDMVKLICVTFGVPLERFFDMPMSYYCQCCSMPIPDEEMHGTEADGSKSADFCKYCYDHGDFTAKGMTMDECKLAFGKPRLESKMGTTTQWTYTSSLKLFFQGNEVSTILR